MKIIGSIYNLSDIEKFSKFTDGFIIGLKDFSVRFTKYFSKNDLKKILEKCKKLNKELYLNLNASIIAEELENYEKLLKEIKDYNLKILFSDLGILTLATSLNMQEKLIYSPITLLTNCTDFNYFSKFNLKGAVASNQISLYNLKELIKEKKYFIYFYGFGFLNIFQSRRKLITAYFKEKKLPLKFEKNKNSFSLKEETRNEKYPVIEEKKGSNIFQSQIFSVYDFLDEITDLDYLILDNILIEKDIYFEAIKFFYNKINFKDSTSFFISTDSGFLLKDILYRREDL